MDARSRLEDSMTLLTHLLPGIFPRSPPIHNRHSSVLFPTVPTVHTSMLAGFTPLEQQYQY